MSEPTQNSGEKSAEIPEDAAGAHELSLRTNARMRQKYYVDEKDVISSIQSQSRSSRNNFSKIIRHAGRPTAARPVMIRCNLKPQPGEIKVDVIREGTTVKGIRINCPCGRHTEVNFEYNPAAADKPQ